MSYFADNEFLRCLMLNKKYKSATQRRLNSSTEVGFKKIISRFYEVQIRKYKHAFFCILLLVIIPAKVLLAQTNPAESDTTVRSEADIRYDSILSKAALLLSASDYDTAISLYKQATVIKPGSIFPYKMINYAEEASTKQKRADDLKRRAKIREDLSKANNAIADKNWDTAKVLFTEILALNPEKTDQEFAKSKLGAIDLELQRIVAKIPPKPVPVVIAPPKNRREVRARRIMAERNAKLAAANAQAPSQTPVLVENIVVPSAAEQIQQKPVADTLNKQIAATTSTKKETVEKATEISIPDKKIISTPAIEDTAQKPTETPLAEKAKVIVPPVKEIIQKPAETSSLKETATASMTAGKEMSSAPAKAFSLTLADSTDYIKLICQDISFIGTNAYIKVLIQNYSTTKNFRTDTLQVSLKKNNGTLNKLEQRFISSFPVILPLGESIFVSFADASIGVNPDDVFILEMLDKTKKTKLALQIPWAAYQQHKNL